MATVIWSSNLLVTEPNLDIYCSSGFVSVHREVLACHSSLMSDVLLGACDSGSIILPDFELADVIQLFEVGPSPCPVMQLPLIYY